MNRLMANLSNKFTPKMTPAIMNGLAVIHMERAEEYIHSVLKGLNKSLKVHKLEYVNYERCTPEEEYAETTKNRNNKRSYDLAPTDIYMIKLKFLFDGLPVPDRFIYMPFVREAGIMNISGSMYHLSPVVSDPVISPDTHNIFVRLLRDRIKFFRCYHSIVINGIRETTQVCWSPLYRKPPDKRSIPPTTRAFPSIAHYLFAKFGFKDTFLRFGGVIPEVSQGEFTAKTHPPSEWYLCESSSTSSNVKPRTYIGEYYTPTKLQLAVRKDQWNPTTASLIEGFFYVVDHFPEQLNMESLETNALWMILLGHIYFTGHYGYNKLYTKIEEHFNTLNNILDPIIAEKLHRDGYEIEDVYQLMAMLMGNWNDLVTRGGQSKLSMYGKTLEILYYALYPITEAIFLTNFKITKFAMKRPLTMKDVIDLFNRNLRVRAVFKLASQSIITESVSYSGDHKYPKITSKLAGQENWSQGDGGRKTIGPDQHLDMSQVTCGSVLFLSKADPSPTRKVNPYALINPVSNTFIRNPELTAIEDKTQALFDKK